jgi:hypothetical protein
MASGSTKLIWRKNQKYFNMHHLTYPRVVIIDRLSEIVVLEIRDGKIIFPEELQGRDPWKDKDENK